MAYVVKLKDGTTITLPSAAREERDGSGVRFYDADGNGCGSFADGEVAYAFPADAEVAAAPAPVEEGEA